jgi:thioredoxin-related protein
MIKYIFSLILLCSIGYTSNTANSKHIKWHGHYEKALIKAKKENKNIMLVIRKKNCDDCQKIFTTTFVNQDYIKMLNEKYISIIATFEDENSYPIELFYTLDFPAIFFVDAKDESFLKDPILGYITPQEFKKIVTKE